MVAQDPNVRDTRAPDNVDPLLTALEDRGARDAGPSTGTRVVIAVVVLLGLALLIYKQSF